MRIRVMTLADLVTVLGWAREEGWNPGHDDARAFRAADPDGFLLGEIEGQPAAAISVVRHAPSVAFLGLYIVRPAFRGQGHGIALWRAGMARLEGAAVGLDGVVAQQDNYRRSGFSLSHRNIRFTGPVPEAAKADGVLPIAGALRDAVLARDAEIAGYERPAFLSAWLADGPTRRSRALVRDGALRAFGTARTCHEGAKIGPLFAETVAEAEILFRALLEGTGGPVSLDAPEPNGEAVALAGRLGLSPSFETARMWRGPPPPEQLSRVFGVATFELG